MTGKPPGDRREMRGEMQGIHVSSNRRFLVTEDGAPFFWLGDTAWELFHRCDRDEVEHYLENRRQKGFNLIQAVVLAEEDGLNTPNSLGHTPLLGNDPTRPDEAYFAHVDFVVERAAARGLYVGMLPTWGDKVNAAWGVGPVVFTAENARRYGRFLGERYRAAPNIVWILGGDRPVYDEGRDYGPITRAMARGIREGVGGHALMTFHPSGGRGSSSEFHDEEWLDLNMWQSGHRVRDYPNWEMIGGDYARSPTKPTLDGEPCYEDHPIDPWSREWRPEHGYFRDHEVRKQAYRAVFAGAAGHTYGHHSVWQMYLPERPAKNHPYCTWLEALDRPGAGQMIHLRRLMTSRPYLTRIPDQGLLRSEEGSGGDHVRATRCSQGSYALVYIPNAGQAVEVELDWMAGETATVWWFRPRDGSSERVGEVPSRGAHSFTAPENGPDWVLVLDDASRRFPPPGTET